eukprot:Seg5874.1 transcript_id=Seg5874.1/GoldUCD/mRNA.D3Y31 product="hypothetical protein" protein_id=Seg5874.1/GoldUCD/D3Y31
MIQQNPELLLIKKVGHDLDNAIGNGLTDILRNAERLYCTEHLQKADERHMKEKGANASTIKRIMADIYGTQHGFVEELGLADALDPDDFDVKLASLKVIWDGLLPNFHAWFIARRSKVFKTNLVISARTKLNIKGRFYTNGLESGHRLQKKFLADEGHISSDVIEVNKFLSQWVEEFYSEAVRALRGVGRYRLADGYEKFFVESSKWNQWSPQRRQQHADQFFSSIPTQSQCYKKPASAGLKKAPRAQRRVEKEEPQFFLDRTAAVPVVSNPKVTPIKLKKSATKPGVSQSAWSVAQRGNSTNEDTNDPLNPDRHLEKKFLLVHRSDSKNCPSSVKRCQSCKRVFTASDWVVVRTEGIREWTAANGKQKSSSGNIYIHYLRSCLMEYQQSFVFTMVTVPKSTLAYLPPDAAVKFRGQGCVIEN